MRIGPEPTTDSFMAILHGKTASVTPGHVAATNEFGSLSKFGNNFLEYFQRSNVDSPILERISLIDSPGILSGEQDRVNRGYPLPEVVKWFAERVDRILLLFDPNKLDISDEFRRCIDVLQDHKGKVRIVLNKVGYTSLIDEKNWCA